MENEKPPMREQEEELEQMRKLPVQDQIEYLLVKIQGHEDILKDMLFLAGLLEEKIQEFSQEATAELKKKYISEHKLE